MTAQASRRAFIAGISAAPIAALPAVADQVANVATCSDPIFAALDAESRAQEAWQAAANLCAELDAIWKAKYANRAPSYIVLPDGSKAFTQEHVAAYFRPHAPLTRYGVQKRIHEVLNKHFEELGAGKEDAAPSPPAPKDVRLFLRRVESAARRLRNTHALRRRLQNECGITAAEAAYEARAGEAIAAERALLSTAPATQEGAAALMRYTARYIDMGRGDAEDVLPAIEGVSVFLSKGGADV